MTTVKQNADRIIKYFSDKTLKKGCKLKFLHFKSKIQSEIVTVKNDKFAILFNNDQIDWCGYELLQLNYERIGSPVMISDVLFSGVITICVFDEKERDKKIIELWGLWLEFGNKSLNEIFEGKLSKNPFTDEEFDRFGDPEIQALYKFLLNLVENEPEFLKLP